LSKDPGFELIDEVEIYDEQHVKGQSYSDLNFWKID